MSTCKSLTVRELIGQLMYMPPDAAVTLFAKGENYPVLQVQQMEGFDDVEIGGGWASIEEGF